MERFFNIAGPCNPADHYMLSATERLPEVVSLIHKKQYFVIHAQRQCGKTTAMLALRNEINAGGERVAMYCSLEAAVGREDRPRRPRRRGQGDTRVLLLTRQLMGLAGRGKCIM